MRIGGQLHTCLCRSIPALTVPGLKCLCVSYKLFLFGKIVMHLASRPLLWLCHWALDAVWTTRATCLEADCSCCLSLGTRFRRVREAFRSWVIQNSLWHPETLRLGPSLHPHVCFSILFHVFFDLFWLKTRPVSSQALQIIPEIRIDQECLWTHLDCLSVGTYITVVTLFHPLDRDTKLTSQQGDTSETIYRPGLLFLPWFISKSIKRGVFIYYLC